MRICILLVCMLISTQVVYAQAKCTTVGECAQLALEAAEMAQHALSIAAPAGAVISFDLDKCPRGWAIFKPASGRFIRGASASNTVDPDGPRAVGSIQQDALQGHRHAMEGRGGRGLWDSAEGTGPSRRAATTNYKDRKTHLVLGVQSDLKYGNARVSSETRPENVALLYCRRQNQ